MPTIMEIADLADLPVEGVLRVVNGQPVSERIAERVRKAIEAIGAPQEGVVQNMNVLTPPTRPPVRDVIPARTATTRDDLPAVAAQEQLIEKLGRATAELDAHLPEGVGGVVYEAVRVEVEPVARNIDQMGELVEQLGRVIVRLDESASLERQARLGDLKLLTDLIVSGWRSVDQRLARLERMLSSDKRA